MGAGGIAVTRGDDRDLVDLRQRRRHRPDHFGKAGDELVHDGSLVPFLIGLGLDVHGLRFGLTFLEDDLGLGLALRARGRGVTFGLRHQPLPLGVRQRLDALTIDLRLLQYSGDELFLAPRDLGLLNLHLLLFLDLLYAHGFSDDLLLHDVRLDLVRLVRLRLLLLDAFHVLRALHFELALCVGLFRQRCRLGFDALLIGLRFRDRRLALRLCALDRGVALRFGSGDIRVAFDARDVRAAHVADVFILVLHFFDREGDDLQTHLRHVAGARGTHAIGDHLRLLHDLFDCELADDSAQVTFHHQAD